MDKLPLIVFETSEQLAQAAAERFVEGAAKVDGGLGRFSVALAGGRTPKRVYELLATEAFSSRVHWPKVHLFFGDERAVPPTDPESNYAMVHEALLSKIAIPAGNVHRMNGEDDPQESATNYETELKTFFPRRDWPRFDLVLLGMGDDGHTASLFPRSEALAEKARWVVATKNLHTGQDRITLTLPVINHAAQVIFLVNGNEKAQRLAEVLRPQPGSELLPAQAVKPVDGNLEWFVDAAAANCL